MPFLLPAVCCSSFCSCLLLSCLLLLLLAFSSLFCPSCCVAARALIVRYCSCYAAACSSGVFACFFFRLCFCLYALLCVHIVCLFMSFSLSDVRSVLLVCLSFRARSACILFSCFIYRSCFAGRCLVLAWLCVMIAVCYCLCCFLPLRCFYFMPVYVIACYAPVPCPAFLMYCNCLLCVAVSCLAIASFVCTYPPASSPCCTCPFLLRLCYVSAVHASFLFLFLYTFRLCCCRCCALSFVCCLIFVLFCLCCRALVALCVCCRPFSCLRFCRACVLLFYCLRLALPLLMFRVVPCHGLYVRACFFPLHFLYVLVRVLVLPCLL